MTKTAIVALLGAGFGLALACSSGEGAPNPVSYGGAGASGPGGAGGTGGVGGGGAAGLGALGGVGGGINVDSGGTSDANPDAPCEGIRRDVLVESLPVDIIWAIDTSLSMVEESVAVQQNINTFSQQIIDAKIDVHVVMLSGNGCFLGICGGLGVCVGPPLGTGQCMNPGGDSIQPTFFHHPQVLVNSNDGAAVLVDQFPGYRQMLRPAALKYVVIVTDDDSTGGSAGPYADNPDRFVADYTALDPMMSNASGTRLWKMSGIYAHTDCPNSFAVGTFWKGVIDRTGGVHGDICSCPAGQQAACTQTFKAVLDSLAQTIVTAAKPLDCEYAIPAPPAGKTFQKDQVNVNLVTGGATEDIYWVNDASACHAELGGWYYDDNANPTKVLTCPKSCERIKATTNGSISIAFGCARKPIPIAQ